ncbi:toxin-antitoxin system HicB family antitoxin [Streptomyces sp. NPDC048405]|uniref:toxin-antitoxin system HicB family antitoxin n=1 Tax=Streptomyces sp. NPDC048405 TaxID=3365544 RepID=UPI00371CCBDE
MSVTTMTLRVPDDLAPSIRAAASEAGLSVNAYVVRAARRRHPRRREAARHARPRRRPGGRGRHPVGKSGHSPTAATS